MPRNIMNSSRYPYSFQQALIHFSRPGAKEVVIPFDTREDADKTRFMWYDFGKALKREERTENHAVYSKIMVKARTGMPPPGTCKIAGWESAGGYLIFCDRDMEKNAKKMGDAFAAASDDTPQTFPLTGTLLPPSGGQSFDRLMEDMYGIGKSKIYEVPSPKRPEETVTVPLRSADDRADTLRIPCPTCEGQAGNEACIMCSGSGFLPPTKQG